MSRFILASEDSGAGHLKFSLISRPIGALGYVHVCGPAPNELNLVQFFVSRSRLIPNDAPEWERELGDTGEGGNLQKFVAKIEEFDRVELWADPGPNSQLQLIQLLAWFRGNQNLRDKFALVQLTSRLGERTGQWARDFSPSFLELDQAAYDLALRCWCAFLSANPQAWFELLEQDLEPFQQMRSAIMTMLAELPHVHSGLMATQLEMLRLIGESTDPTFRNIATRHTRSDDRIYDLWRLGGLLLEMCNCREPLISGPDEPDFTLEMCGDRVRYRRFKESPIKLTAFGKSVLDGCDDFTRLNPIHRWWGGTLLTNDALWRWDPEKRELISP